MADPQGRASHPRGASHAQRVMEGLVDINNARAEDLAAVSGIGAARAKQIVVYRRKFGPFETVDDLQRIPDFSPAEVASLRGRVKAGRM